MKHLVASLAGLAMLLTPLLAQAQLPKTSYCLGVSPIDAISCGGGDSGWYIDKTTGDMHYLWRGTDWLEVTGSSTTVTLQSNQATTLAIAEALTFSSTLGVTGAVTLSSTLGVVSQTVGVPFNDMRVHDNLAALLPVAAANDDLGNVPGTVGTTAPSLQTADEGGTGSEQHHYATFSFVMPASYVAGSTVTLRLHGGMLRVADQASTTVIDVEAWVPDYANGDLTVSSDLCTTDPITAINNTTFANHDFTIGDAVAGHALAAGSVIQFKLRMTVDDNGNAGDNITMVVDKIDVIIST